MSDKTVVITGASSGIGEAAALLLAAKGAKVVLGARRTEKLDALVKTIEEKGGTALAQTTDVTKKDDVNALVAKAKEAYGEIDVMINNAGIMPIAPLDMACVDDWDRMIDVNIKGLLYGIAAVLPDMKRRKSGHIINIASIAGMKVFPNFAVYCATKHAVRAISEGLRLENPDVRTTVISPGLIETELPNSTTNRGLRVNLKDYYSQHAIKPQAIAEAIAYAIEQPDSVDVNEMVIRPTTQDL